MKSSLKEERLGREGDAWPSQEPWEANVSAVSDLYSSSPLKNFLKTRFSLSHITKES
jgi:hypothetical protein